jgi:hypothetical protein
MPATAVAMAQYSAALTTWIVPRIKRSLASPSSVPTGDRPKTSMVPDKGDASVAPTYSP